MRAALGHARLHWLWGGGHAPGLGAAGGPTLPSAGWAGGSPSCLGGGLGSGPTWQPEGQEGGQRRTWEAGVKCRLGFLSVAEALGPAGGASRRTGIPSSCD